MRREARISLAPLRQALAGALGGLLAALLLEPGAAAAEQPGIDSLLRWARMVAQVFLLGVGFGGIVTAFLACSDELPSLRPGRILLRTLGAGLLGAVVGVGASIGANVIFNVALAVMGSGPGLILARTLGWALFGAGVGVSLGIVSRSARRSLQGCAGGALGGAAGGFAFDMLAAVTQRATESRLVGFVALGIGIGFATALVEHVTRVAWLTFLSGSRDGRQLLLHRDTAVLGRDELAEAPLFGDPRVERRHALLSLTPTPTIHELGAGGLLRVDGRPAREADLGDGSLIEIGRHRLRFHVRGTRPAAAPAGAPVLREFRRPETAPAVATAAPPDLTPAELVLRVIEGPLAGARLPLAGEPLTLGREPGNAVVVPDQRVSRFHAAISKLEGAWVVTDLGSRNGTAVNGVRVRRAGIAPGDVLSLGGTVLYVEPPGADGPAGSPPVTSGSSAPA